MMKRIKHIFIACGAVAISASAISVQAAERPEMGDGFAYALQSELNTSSKARNTQRVLQFAQQSRRVSASQAKSIALRRNPGARFINVQLRGNRYRVRLQLKNGRIKDVYVDAGPRQVRN